MTFPCIPPVRRVRSDQAWGRRLFCGVALALGALPALVPAAALARGGGGFGGGFGGGGWSRGYQGYHPAYGPNARPAWQGGGSVNRDAFDKNTVDKNTLEPNTLNRNFDNDSFQKTVNVNNNFYNRDGNGWNRNWANGGYWNNRPWATGWYGWSPGTWGWWGGSAAAWGVAGLATGVAISSLVNDAANNQKTVIVVPGSTFQLDYGSVEGVGSYGASFSYNLDQGGMLNGAANCQAGLLNGQVPGTADQAQLLNAVCQVAYGAGS